MNLRHPADEPSDIQDLLSAVCYYFTGNHFYKLMRQRVRDELRSHSKSFREDSETLVQRMTDVFAGTEPSTTTRTLEKCEAATPLPQSDRRTRPGEHPFQDSEHSAVALRERGSTYEGAGSFHPWAVLLCPLFIVPAAVPGHCPNPPDSETFQAPAPPPPPLDIYLLVLTSSSAAFTSR